MISIRKYLQGEDAELCEALARMCRLVLEAAALHAVEGDPADLSHFQGDIRRLEQALDGPLSGAEVVAVTGEAVKAIQEYGRTAGRFLRGKFNELQNIVAMLTNTISAIVSGSDRSRCKLQQIEQQIERASKLEDIQQVKLRLGECLELVREEMTARQQETSQMVCHLSEEIRKLHELTPPPNGFAADPLTGLPARRQAEAAVHQAAAAEEPVYVAVFLVSRLQPVNHRFGREVGDQMLRLFSQHLARRLSAADKVFRWDGPGFIALLNRPAPVRLVRDEVQGIVSTRLEMTIEVNGRAVLLPVSSMCTVLELKDGPPADVVRRIDRFLNAAGEAA